MERLNLNLGCSTDYRESTEDDKWVNIDLNPNVKADIYHDLHTPLPFDDLSVDHIYASHVLEHCGFHVVNYCVADWVRVLKIGGTINIRTPDLRSMAEEYVRVPEFYLRFMQGVFGGGYRSKVGSTHQICVDWPWLNGQLWTWGCTDIKRYGGDKWELCVTARKATHNPREIPAIDVFNDQPSEDTVFINATADSTGKSIVEVVGKKRGRKPRATS